MERKTHEELLISLGVVAMMFFAPTSSVEAKTCAEKAEAFCAKGPWGWSGGTDAEYCMETYSNDHFTCNQTTDADKWVFCNKYCTNK